MAEILWALFWNVIATALVVGIAFWSYQAQEKWKMKQQVYLECLEIIDRQFLSNPKNDVIKADNGESQQHVEDLYPLPEEVLKNYNQLALISNQQILKEYWVIFQIKYDYKECKANLLNLMRQDLFGNRFLNIFLKLFYNQNNIKFLDSGEVLMIINGKSQQEIRNSRKLKIENDVQKQLNSQNF